MHKWIVIIRRILNEGRGYIPPFATLGGISLLMVPVELWALLLSRRLIDHGFLQRDWAVVRALLATLFFLFLFRSVVAYITTLFSARLQLRINRKFQDRIFAHLIRLPMRVLTGQPVGRLMSRILDDGTRLSAVYDQLFGSIILEPVKLFFLALVLMVFNLRLFALLLITTVASVGIIHWLGNRLDAISKKIQKKDATLYSYAEEMLSNVELVKSKATEDQTAGQFRRLLDQLIVLSLRIHRITLITRPILQMLKYSALGLILIFGTWMISSGSLSLGTLTLFVGTTLLFFNTLNVIGNTYGRLRENLARLEVVYDLLDTPPEQTLTNRTGPAGNAIASIVCQDVVFGYQASSPVLKGVSLRIVRGEMVGITGQSGSGKTTLIRLFLRFYEPDTGTIQVNGRPAADIALSDLRASIGIVFQENLILNTTARDNIVYGTKDTDEKQILDAARLAGAHDFIQDLPEGYDTVVGEQGRRLSGGQRQRLAIARAIVCDPAVLVLDEATSYLELAQEAEILRRIKEHRKDKITLLVTHRPSAIHMVDRVLTLDNGRLVDTAALSLYKAARGG